jgi:D-alanyl-D-alanine carboxypeptidase
MVAESVNNGQIVQAVAGTTQLGGHTAINPNTHYRTGSVTKTFVSATVLQLVGMGKLSLDDTVDHWLPGLITGNGNDGKKITIRELLQHTSGLVDYDTDSRFLSTISSASEFYANNMHSYTPNDLVSLALSHPPNFAPGTSWSYSNTNYIVAGMVIQAVTGNTWDVEVTNLLIKPLGLTNTSIPGDNTGIPSPYADGYNIWSVNNNKPVYSDTTVDNMSWAGSAGAIITTTDDELKFFTSLMSGKVLAPAQLAQMQTTVPINQQDDYGLGLARMDMCNVPGGVWWHNGGTVGYDTFVGVTPDGSTGVAYDVATTDLTGSDTAFDSAVHGREDALARHVFCGAATTSTDSITQQEAALHGNPATP